MKNETLFPVMTIDDLKQKLADIDAATLQDFILDLYLHYPELNDKIEALLLYSDPAALANALGKRIQSLRRGPTHRNMRLSSSTDFWRQRSRCSIALMTRAAMWARCIARRCCCG